MRQHLGRKMPGAVLRAVAALLLILVWALPSTQARSPHAPSQPFPCAKGGPCYFWLHGTINFEENASYAMLGGASSVKKHEKLLIAVGLSRRADGLPSALYSDNLSTSDVTKVTGMCSVDDVDGAGTGRGHLEFGYGDTLAALVPWYFSPDYHIVFVPDVGFSATERFAQGDTCGAKASPESDYPKPTMVIVEFIMPARLTNPLLLQGKMITFGKLKQGTEGEGTCQMPDGAKGSDVCTTTWKLTAKFSTEAPPGP